MAVYYKNYTVHLLISNDPYKLCIETRQSGISSFMRIIIWEVN